MGNDKYIDFRKQLKSLFSSPEGIVVINFLRESYVEVPAVDKTPELTYYRLGQKELVQGLIKDIEEDIDKVDTVYSGGEE